MFIDLPELLVLGRIIIPFPLLAFALISLLTNFFIKWRSTRLGISHSQWLEAILNALLTYLFVWKFSYLLFHPLLFWQKPSSLLVAHGGNLGMLLGLLSAAYIGYRTIRKSSLSWKLFLDLTLHWLLLSFALYWLLFRAYGLPTSLPWGMALGDPELTYHPLNLYHFLLTSVLLLCLHLGKVRLGEGTYAAWSLFALGLGLLLFSNLAYHPWKYGGLAKEQWFYLALTGLGLALLFTKKETKINHRTTSE